jgi:long-chain acyl-CoA synthetase
VPSQEPGDPGTGTLVELFDRRARQGPGRAAIRVKRKAAWQAITWQQYLTAVQAAACALDARGVGPGTRITLAATASPEVLYVELAAQAVGARLFVVDPTAVPARLEQRLRVAQADLLLHAGASALVALPDWFTREVADAVPMSSLLAGAPEDAEATWGTILDRRLGASCGLYTSAGTTGPVRCVDVAAANLVASWQAFCATYSLGPRDRMIAGATTRLGLHRAAALAVPVLSGATVFFRERRQSMTSAAIEVRPTVLISLPGEWEARAEAIERRLDAATGPGRMAIRHLLPDRSAPSGTRASGAAAQLGDLLVRRPLRRHLGVQRLRVAAVGGASMRPGLSKRWERLGVRLLEIYTLAEAGGPVALGVAARDGIRPWLAPTPERAITVDEATGTIRVAIGAGRPAIDTGDVGAAGEDGRLREIARGGDLVPDPPGPPVNLRDLETSARQEPGVAQCVLSLRPDGALGGIVELRSDGAPVVPGVPQPVEDGESSTGPAELRHLAGRLDEQLAGRGRLRVTRLCVAAEGERELLTSETGDPRRHQGGAPCSEGLAGARAGRVGEQE